MTVDSEEESQCQQGITTSTAPMVSTRCSIGTASTYARAMTCTQGCEGGTRRDGELRRKARLVRLDRRCPRRPWPARPDAGLQRRTHDPASRLRRSTMGMKTTFLV